MQMELKTTTPTPSQRQTVPRLRAAPPMRHAVPASSGWLEPFRSELGYDALTVVLDIWAASWSVVLALWLTPGTTADRHINLYTWFFVPIVVVLLSTRGAHRRKLGYTFLDEFEPVETSVAVSALATLTVMMVLVPRLPHGSTVGEYVRPSDVAVRLWICAGILVPAVRLVRSLAQRYLRRNLRFGAPALILGSDAVARQLIRRMQQVPDYGLRPVGLLDDIRPIDADSLGVPYLGTTDDVEVAARATKAQKLIVAHSSVPDEQLVYTIQRALNLGLRVRIVPRLMDVVGSSARVEHLGGVPLMVLSQVHPKGWQFAVKHALECVIAGVGLLLISPLFLTLALLVKLSSPGPIMFRQQRVGRDGKVFDCLKFRTMRPANLRAARFEPKDGSAPGGVEGEDRRTWIGKAMRKASLDELPQLLNVLRGDMSLVGPRPERPEFVELFEMQIRRYGDRHRVKAGMTGWAQVHGLRGQTSIADRAEFDNFYIENWSLLLDLKILVLTVLAVVRPTED